MLTGAQYLESLDDGRRIFLDGKQTNAATEPLFADVVGFAAEGYDRYYDATPGAHGPYFDMPTSVEELHQVEELQKGWDMVTSTTAQGLRMLLTASSRMRSTQPELAERIDAHFASVRDRDLRCVQTITDAKGDRSLPPSKQDDPDFYLRIVDRQADGVVIRGAKLHISAAAVAHELIVMPTKRMKPGEEDWAIACAVPVNEPNVLIVNTTNAPRGSEGKGYYPYSSRWNAPEGFIVFDDVFVPNDRLFLCGQTEHSATFAHSLGLWERLGLIAHLADLGDVLVGLAQLIAEANGLQRIPHIKDKIADMMIYATLLRATYEAAVGKAETTSEGWVSPNELYCNAGKYHGSAEFASMVRNLHDIAGGAVLTAPTENDLANPITGPFIEKYMRTMPGVDAAYRMRLFHTIRDFTADTYGGWQHVTMLQAGGGLFAQKTVATKHYDIDKAKAAALAVAGLAK